LRGAEELRRHGAVLDAYSSFEAQGVSARPRSVEAWGLVGPDEAGKRSLGGERPDCCGTPRMPDAILDAVSAGPAAPAW